MMLEVRWGGYYRGLYRIHYGIGFILVRNWELRNVVTGLCFRNISAVAGWRTDYNKLWNLISFFYNLKSVCFSFELQKVTSTFIFLFKVKMGPFVNSCLLFQ
jgi:hypothetical protein